MSNAVLGGAVGLPWIAAHSIAYPALEVLHITGIGLLLGSLVLLELRVLGLAHELTRRPLARLKLDLPAEGLKLPADLAARSLPAQAAPVDGTALLPTRRGRRWEIELAPLLRMQAWGVPEIKVGDALGMLGFTFTGEKGDAVLRVEYLFAAGKVYAMRSSPA